MNYFNKYTQVARIKNKYHQLAKLHHPDLGGSTEIMQNINDQYQIALKGCDGQIFNNRTYVYSQADIELQMKTIKLELAILAIKKSILKDKISILDIKTSILIK